MTVDYFTILLIVVILLMLYIRSRFQKKATFLQGNICSWSRDHWVTGTPILLSTLNEITNIDLASGSDQSLTLQNWLSDKLNRSVRSSDVIYHDNLTFLVLPDDNSVYYQVHIYPSRNPSNEDTKQH